MLGKELQILEAKYVLVCGVMSVYQSGREHDYERGQRLKVKKIAYDEISLACRRLTDPFIDMYVNQKGCRRKRDDVYALLITDPAIKLIKDVGLMEKPLSDRDISGFEDHSYAEAIDRAFKSEPARLEQTMKTFSYYLDADDIVLIDAISHHEYVGGLRNYVKNGGRYPFDSLEEDSHKDFFSKVG